MKKTLLLTVAIALMAMVFFGCQNQVQPISGDIVTKADSAPAVAADKIKAEAVEGGILVSWEAANENAGYYVYRQEVKDGPQEGTTTLVNGSNTSYTANKKIPYYWDADITNGVAYRYGIVSRGYKTPAGGYSVSDIIWQSEDKAATGKGKQKSKEKIKQDLPTTLPSATFEKVQTSHPATVGSGLTDTPEEIVVKVTGLTYGYKYDFKLNYNNVGGSAAAETNWSRNNDGTIGSTVTVVFKNATTSSGSSTPDEITSSYLEKGNFDQIASITPSSVGGPSGDTYSTTGYPNYAGRVIASISSAVDGYFVDVTKPDSSNVLNSNEKVISGTTSYLVF